jgi:hypothetical protein
MGELLFTRRAALAALTMAAASAPLMASAGPLGAVRFREVRVDVSPLHEKDEDEEAAWIAAVLPGYLKQKFANYLAPGDRSAGILVARIDNVTLGWSHSGMGLGLMATDTTDGIEGVGLALDARGRQVGAYPLYSAFGADTQPNSPYQTDIRRRRVETLALSFAQWLPGKMGL